MGSRWVFPAAACGVSGAQELTPGSFDRLRQQIDVRPDPLLGPVGPVRR